MEGNVLLTGFEPFGGNDINPSGVVAESLDGKQVSGFRICGVVLPVEWGATKEVMESTICRIDPVMILSLGLSSGSPDMNVEKVAVNYMSQAKDNKGNLPDGSKICGQGPDAYFATIPVEDVVDGLRGKGIPARLSLSAGGYLCNYTFYVASKYVAEKERREQVPVGFIHVPATPEMVAESGRSIASMDLGMIEEGVLTAIGVSIKILARRG